MSDINTKTALNRVPEDYMGIFLESLGEVVKSAPATAIYGTALKFQDDLDGYITEEGKHIPLYGDQRFDLNSDYHRLIAEAAEDLQPSLGEHIQRVEQVCFNEAFVRFAQNPHATDALYLDFFDGIEQKFARSAKICFDFMHVAGPDTLDFLVRNKLFSRENNDAMIYQIALFTAKDFYGKRKHAFDIALNSKILAKQSRDVIIKDVRSWSRLSLDVREAVTSKKRGRLSRKNTQNKLILN